jgi:hypothetical protein
MSKQNEPRDSASSEEEAELRALRRIASALERGDIDELAAALSQEPDQRGLDRRTMSGRKKSNSL